MSKQAFDVRADNLDTGESWQVRVCAPDPGYALSMVLRRKMWREWLLSEQPFRFTVLDEFSV